MEILASFNGTLILVYAGFFVILLSVFVGVGNVRRFLLKPGKEYYIRFISLPVVLPFWRPITDYLEMYKSNKEYLLFTGLLLGAFLLLFGAITLIDTLVLALLEKVESKSHKSKNISA